MSTLTATVEDVVVPEPMAKKMKLTNQLEVGSK